MISLGDAALAFLLRSLSEVPAEPPSDDRDRRLAMLQALVAEVMTPTTQAAE